jgi:hypothetical protein
VPVELTKRWQIKIALVVGLRVLPARYRPLFDRLATIRNRLADGEIHNLTRRHVTMLLDAIRDSLGETAEENADAELRWVLQDNEPILSLRLALSLARNLLHASAADARERREEERQAVIAQRQAREERDALFHALTFVRARQDHSPGRNDSLPTTSS